MKALTIESEEHGGTTLLVLRGDLELNTAPGLREALAGVIDDRARIVVDMEAVDFLDSAGLGILVGGLKRARERDGDLELICSSRAVLRPLELTGLDRAFTIHRARDAALGDRGTLAGAGASPRTRRARHGAVERGAAPAGP